LGSYLLPHVLPEFLEKHPDIEVEVDLSNRTVDLTRREADLALRATMNPPEHLIGRKIGEVTTAVYAAKTLLPKKYDDSVLDQLPWIGFDERIAWIPQAIWMRERLSHITPRLRMDSFLAIMRSAAIGVGAANLPCFAAAQENNLIRVSQPIDGPRMELWLLSHPDVRGNARVRALLQHLAEQIPSKLDCLVQQGPCATKVLCPMKGIDKTSRRRHKSAAAA
jgi:DNA-binding transcriptional LysR family regulator